MTSLPARLCDVIVSAPVEDDVIGYDHERRCHGVNRPREFRHRNTTWTSLTIGMGQEMTSINIFSAYYDERTFRRKLPSVRLLLTSSGDLENQDVHCQLWYSPIIAQPYITKATITPLTKAITTESGLIHQYIVNCDIFSTAAKPLLVSLTTARCENATNAIRVVSPLHTRRQHEFGICVTESVMTENKAEWLVEWMEAHRLFGVEHVTFYNMSLSKRTGFVMENYAASGQANIIPITALNNLPIPSYKKLRRHEIKYFQNPYYHIIVNDCLLRNMYKYRYTILTDYSKIIMYDRGDDISYTNLVKQTHKEDIASLVFNIRLVSGHDNSSLTKSDSELPAPLHRYRKSSAFIANPDLCTHITNMTCRSVDLASIGHSVISIRDSRASVYVFDGCNIFGKDQCHFVKFKDPQTNRVLKGNFIMQHLFGDRLKERVKRRHEMIRLDYDW